MAGGALASPAPGTRFAGDGGPAIDAQLDSPAAVALDQDGNLLIADTNHSRVRRIQASAVCGDGVLDDGEECDDGNRIAGDCCSATCTIESAATVCRPAIGDCDVAELCSGSSATCPSDVRAASGVACTSDGNACTADVCDGAGTCTHPAQDGPCDDGSFCNGADTCSAGECSIHAGDPCANGGECANTCNEWLGSCNVPAYTACRDDGSFCTEDYCDGNGSCTHPAARAGQVCRPATGDCDVAEVCDGLAASCPPDHFKPGTTVCRAAAGECDVAESCSGASSECPADTKSPAGTACTPDTSVCTTDVCDGSGACTHPPGNAGVICRAAAGDCDVAEQCDGSSPLCPSDQMKSATVTCRASAGECDRAESCTGASPSCPPDVRAPAGTSCTADALICTADVCDGLSAACTHPPGNVGVECRSAVDACDVAETCDGTSTGCPADTGAPDRDGDGSCDARDPCTNVAGAQNFVSPPRSSVVLSRINTDKTPGNDKLAITAVFDLPPGRSFSELRPHLDGARVVLEAASGTSRLDVTLPSGVYTPIARFGWRPNGNASAWTFIDKRPTPSNGIVKLALTDRGQVALRRRVKVVVTGKNGSYPVTPQDLPLTAILTLGNSKQAEAGMCGESAYAAGNCAFNRSGNQLACRR